MRDLTLTPELQYRLMAEGYSHLIKVPGRGICGVFRFVYTVGLVYGIDEEGYTGRWYYENRADAIRALYQWNGEGDPSGEWIRYKGKGDERSRIPDPYEQ